MITLLVGDCREVLRGIADASVNCCVTSPPYWGLRDYGVEGQSGLEASVEAYLEEMVQVFREVRRVLADDGTLWLNLGDSYASRAAGGRQGQFSTRVNRASVEAQEVSAKRPLPVGFKPKDMIGIPFRVAFALQADGWFFRQDIVWHKLNPMPSSVKDRFTTAHEFIFLFSKSERYFFDQEAVKEPVSGTAHARRSMKSPDGWDTSTGSGGHGSIHRTGREKGRTVGGRKTTPAGSGIRNNESFNEAMAELVTHRNKRDVWSLASQPCPESHFATFPEALIRPCILAGCPLGGTVLDNFGGTGTTGKVAEEEGRNSVLIELNPEYADMSRRRTAQMGLFCDAAGGGHREEQRCGENT